jgi:hypothetical protein
MLSSARGNSVQQCEINVPCHTVFQHLCDFAHWRDWNPCVRFCADLPLEGGNWIKVKLASPPKRKGDKRRWNVVDFAINSVNRTEYVVSWTTRLGFTSNTATVKLMALGAKRTLLTHTQSVRGPLVSMGDPVRILMTNAVCINQTLKNHVECIHFQAILMNLSTRDFVKSSTLTIDSDWSETSADFWQSPHYLREQVVAQLMEGGTGSRER